MDMFDAINLILYNISEEIRILQKDYDENILSDNGNNILNNILIHTNSNISNNLYDENISNINNNLYNENITNNSICNCSKYNEYNITCKHIINNSNINNNNSNSNIDISLYASQYYHKHYINNIINVKPLINMGPGMYRNLKHKIKIMNKK
ncbi:hypothetical protein EHP00_2472 [Ecytonucleospora hepatopenaei]|uniref:SWIM-type domain-containing protein n=1 Tax=Ecytonucleospora hepatopenaei TaxID=646526 RepID=A0A1W0E8T4_9MICR|nr:hypothetical protein EHP00_2472 [Ecytonucleospora hepatopenaei]